jgi:hypothetical protein
VTAFLRRAGAAYLADGAQLVWSVADGTRGRRWRAMSSADGIITHALLLEVDIGGRPARLELTTPAGLLTLHPGPDGTSLHGNVVTSLGIRHLTFAWSGEHGLSVDGRPLADAVTAHRLADTAQVGETRPVAVVAITPDLTLREETVQFERRGDATWRIMQPGGEHLLVIDALGIPAALTDAVEWPLELD